MGDRIVKFLGKGYYISDQLPLFVPLLQTFDHFKELLLDKVVEQIKQNTYSSGADEDFAYWDTPIRTIAKSIIQDASKNGIYDLTEYELVDNNPGYKELVRVCTETMRQMCLNLATSMTEWMEGYDNAYAKAASNITGSGVGILTNSLSGALLYSAMEGNVLRKQAKEADKQFNQALRILNEENNKKQANEDNRIKAQVYYPGCKSSIDILITHMFDLYLNKLNASGILNCSEIVKYDLKKSLEIMNNLDIIPQKAEVLGKAFERCPYNSAIFIKALDLSLIDDNSIETIKYLKLDRDFLAVLNDRIGIITDIKEIKYKITSQKYYIHLAASFLNISDIKYIHNMTKSVHDELVRNYKYLNSLLTDDSLCNSFSKEITDEQALYEYIHKYINSIAPDGYFDILKNECGYPNLISEIKPEGKEDCNSKQEIDNYYYNELTKKCKVSINKRLESEKEEEKKKNELAEREKQRQKTIKKKQIKTAIWITSIVALFILFIVTIFYFIPLKKYKNAKKLMDTKEYSEAIQAFENINNDGKYKNEIKECKKQYAYQLMENGDFNAAEELILKIDGIDKTSDIYKECQFRKANEYMLKEDYLEAREIFKSISGYENSDECAKECTYLYANELMNSNDFDTAKEEFESIINYKNSAEKITEIENEKKYQEALEFYEKGDIHYALLRFVEISDYKDSQQYIDDNLENVLEELVADEKYQNCITLCDSVQVYNDYYYQSNYELGISAFNDKNYSKAKQYLLDSNNYKDDVADKIDYCNNISTYESAIKDAGKGMIDDALEKFSKISGFENASAWIAKCNTALSYTGKFSCYKMIIYHEDGEVVDCSSSYKNEVLYVSASINENMEIKYFSTQTCNGYIASFESKGSTTTIDVSARTKKIQWLNSDGSNSDLYMYWYE